MIFGSMTCKRLIQGLGRILLKIQPITICQIERTSDKKKEVKTEDEWSELRIILELSTLEKSCIDSLFGLTCKF